MARDKPAANIEIKVHSRHGDPAVEPSAAAARSRPSRTPSTGFGQFRPFKKWIPWLVPVFVVVNSVLFSITMYVNDCPKNSASCIGTFLGRFSFQPFKENPLLGPSPSTLEKMGALEVDKVVYGHQPWRLISCLWLHAGVFHILANMLSLLCIGIRLEQEFGFVRIGMLYIASGFGGSLLSALFIQSGISVGASGALFGLLGGMLSELLTNWTIYENKLAALLTLVFIIVINLAMGVLPHVDNFAHIGGFISGFFLGFVFLVRPQFGWVSQRNEPRRHSSTSKAKYKPYQYVLWIASFLLLIAGFAVGLVFLFRGENLNDRCSWCHYLSCIPTSKWSCNSQKFSCETSQLGNQLNMTCLSNGRSGSYSLANSTSSEAQQICTQLCS
ncbi:RHOMBOID-like protein 1 [Cucurbita maxima]|uniref:RHOMBOID-like protein n=1 Tax=Cucurbita maxima TaxID=3661 RepID=A0A6J1HZE9_CUCMA|nr:RHOMBOID-like protein 1 [Cucurbita maxima]